MKIANSSWIMPWAAALSLVVALPGLAQESLLPPDTGYVEEDLPPAEMIEPQPLDEQEYIEQGESAEDETGAVDSAWLYPGSPENDRLIDACPALVESSGSWLRRGYWYTEADLVLMQRNFSVGVINLGEEYGTNPFFRTRNVLQLDNNPGAEALVRVKLGRFLFRDEENRDHVAEFTWYGNGNWQMNQSLTAATADGIIVPSWVDFSNNLGLIGEQQTAQTSNISFDGAQSMKYAYQAELDSFEWNYLVKDRMERDQMILRPDGEWVRRAQSTRSKSFLAGFRYVNVADSLNWTATGIPTSTAANPDRGDGTYISSADNDLFGTQLGFSMTTERARWSLGTSLKAGGYYNLMKLDTDFQVLGLDDAVRNEGHIHRKSGNLSFVGELSVIGRWHLTPRSSLRVGAEMLWLESLVATTNNMNFVPGGQQSIHHGAENFLLGTSIGFERYW